MPQTRKPAEDEALCQILGVIVRKKLTVMIPVSNKNATVGVRSTP
ncbi:hypothetical protein QUA86_08855 [Microcoleus sp. F6_B6]